MGTTVSPVFCNVYTELFFLNATFIMSSTSNSHSEWHARN